jgi:hypothetical protein
VDQAREVEPPDGTWLHADTATDAARDTKAWADGIRRQLAMRSSLMTPGPLEVQVVFVVPERSNWTTYWKPAIDALGPILGQDASMPKNPDDARIVSLGLHCVRHGGASGARVGFWWRPAGGALLAPPQSSIGASS